jgi:hypothetical protein
VGGEKGDVGSKRGQDGFTDTRLSCDGCDLIQLSQWFLTMWGPTRLIGAVDVHVLAREPWRPPAMLPPSASRVLLNCWLHQYDDARLLPNCLFASEANVARLAARGHNIHQGPRRVCKFLAAPGWLPALESVCLMAGECGSAFDGNRNSRKAPNACFTVEHNPLTVNRSKKERNKTFYLPSPRGSAD